MALVMPTTAHRLASPRRQRTRLIATFSQSTSINKSVPYFLPSYPSVKAHTHTHTSWYLNLFFFFTDNNPLFWYSLKNDCENESFTSICKALAEVYYAAVQAFGGSDATKREAASDELLAAYEEKMAVYNQLLEAAKEDGSISV